MPLALSHSTSRSSCPTGPRGVAPTKAAGGKEGGSAISAVATRKHRLSIHKHTHGAIGNLPPGSWEAARAQGHLTRQSLWAKGSADAPQRTWVPRSSKRNKDEESPHQLYTLVTYAPVTTAKNLQTVHVGEL